MIWKRIILSLALAGIANMVPAAAPTMDWFEAVGGRINDMHSDVVVDSRGYPIFSASLEDRWAERPDGPGRITFSTALIAKYEQDGARRWEVKGTGWTNDNVEVRRLEIDDNDNVYAVGGYRGEMATLGDQALEPYPGSVNRTFLTKLSSKGKVQWIRYGYPDRFSVDAEGNCYFTMIFSGQRYADEFGGKADGPSRLMLIKLSTEGNRLWGRPLAAAGHQMGALTGSDGAGNILVLGAFGANVVVAGEALPIRSGTDLVLLHLDSEGAVKRIKHWPSPNRERVCQLLVNSDGSFHLVGYSSRIRFDGQDARGAGKEDAFVASFDSKAVCRWIARAGGRRDDRAMDVVRGPDGSVVLTGSIGGGAFDYGGVPVSRNPNSAATAFVARVNARGVFEWFKTLRTPAYGAGRKLAWDPGGRLYVAGQFSRPPAGILYTEKRGMLRIPPAPMAHQENFFMALEWR